VALILNKTTCFIARTSVDSILTEVSSPTYWLVLVLDAHITLASIVNSILTECLTLLQVSQI